MNLCRQQDLAIASLPVPFSLIVYAFVIIWYSLASTVIINTTIVGASNDFDTIVGMVCGIFTLLATGCCGGGNNLKTDGAGGTSAYEFDEMDRSAHQGGKMKATITAIFRDGLTEISEYDLYCNYNPTPHGILLTIDEKQAIKKIVNYLQ